MPRSHIGGYFELELREGESYHPLAMALNSARHCYEYILQSRQYQRVYVPYYTCEVVLHSMQKSGVSPVFYAVNEYLEPQDYSVLAENEAFLYTNYYGLKQDVVQNICSRYGKNAIIDMSVRGAVGLPVTQPDAISYAAYWAIIILHAPQSGRFLQFQVAEAYKDNVVEADVWVRPGDQVNAFNGANDTIGTLVMRFESEKEMDYVIANQGKFITISVR